MLKNPSLHKVINKDLYKKDLNQLIFVIAVLLILLVTVQAPAQAPALVPPSVRLRNAALSRASGFASSFAASSAVVSAAGLETGNASGHLISQSNGHLTGQTNGQSNGQLTDNAPGNTTDHSTLEFVHHNLDVQLLPTLKMIKAQDTITLPLKSANKISFTLNKNLQVNLLNSNASLVLVHEATRSEMYNEYGLTLGMNVKSVTLSYSGIIYDPVVNDSSAGLISAEGATLFEGTHWYPSILHHPKKVFEITIHAPAEWKSISQGQLISNRAEGTLASTQYKAIYPQNEIYLVAGPFTVFETESLGGKKLRVYLRSNDPVLAQNFLSLMPEYIQHFSQLIGPFPYESFSVVENMWETGYGMPGFTLLGPSVLRLPFILTSSLPHEILHNWWGNSVYVNYEKGNWCEGLTNYMADYWQQEIKNNDRSYRMKALISFADFVYANPKNDIPLRSFKARHNSSSQAVGYSKSMMFFHMLDFKFGRDIFNQAMQNFYSAHLFDNASFDDIRVSFEKITSSNLEPYFNQWLDRTSAPVIELTEVRDTHGQEGRFSTSYVLTQKQSLIYDLAVPVVWTLESGQEIKHIANLNDRAQIFTLISNSRPKKISIDPDFHVFRALYPEERPATLSAIFGSPLIHFYYDGNSGEAQQFAQIWSNTLGGKHQLHNISENFEVPNEGALVLIGDKNSFANFMKEQLAEQNFQMNESSFSIDGQTYLLNESSFVLVTRRKNNSNQNIVWVRWSPDNNPSEWAKRLTHYGNAGILVFKGRPAVLQSSWPVTNSPLQRKL